MLKITTIGGGNGQSNLLDAFYHSLDDRVSITSVVSMSDDGRTTGELMKAFHDDLGLHLPPPGDLRRCLFSLSSSEYRDYFKLVFEYTFLNEEKIGEFTIFDLFKQVNKELLFFGRGGDLKEELIKFVDFSDGDLFHLLNNNYSNIFDFKLPLHSSLKGHKFGNILMASLFYNFDQDYDKMIDFMHTLLEVKAKVIPVTTKRARIKAILGNGDVIESQDRISNVASYNSGISDLVLNHCSQDASHNKQVHDTIVESDYIIIGPGDLFTSIISNFIIGGVRESLCESNAKIIYIGNSTNKGGETTGLAQIDFVNKVEMFLGKRIDYFIVNNKKPDLTPLEYKKFQDDISVKGGDFLFLSNRERSELERRKVQVIEADLLDDESFYKHNKVKITELIKNIIFN
ncbi:hypothetical protein A9Q91_03990 [Candidatus Gracilibacteria bacterium 28_42_T64]|nr:hypothetical protein A9Q91_03990 [Candidatus Gracilibacteria bacterium 28_42_T64]